MKLSKCDFAVTRQLIYKYLYRANYNIQKFTKENKIRKKPQQRSSYLFLLTTTN